MSLEKRQAYAGPALLSQGFRPFFLLGAAYAALAIAVWLGWLFGILAPWTTLAPVDWHIHEMIFGYLPAVITGFLLTAVPNWTGRLPVQGWPLAALVGLWLGGRLALAASTMIGWRTAAVIDCLYLGSLVVVIANEIVAGRNWRNLKVLVPLMLLLSANVLFHVEAAIDGTSDLSRRLGLAAVIALVMLIGGRIVPSFTRNWLARQTPGRLPASFGRFDALSLAASGAALIAWVGLPELDATGWALELAALLNAARLARWAGERTGREPLVLVLHVAYFFLPLGLALCGLTVLLPDLVPAAAGLHALGAGAVGTMTLSVMMRASLGHTGGALTMDRPSQLLFALVAASVLARLLAAFDGDRFTLWIILAAAGWIAGFAGFAWRYGPRLIGPRGVSR